MQPYFFPYIGYFQLINAVDKFIIYDDVNYIRRGWVNRNKILINTKANYINVILNNSSQNKLINEITINANFDKTIKTIEQNYKKAPCFNEIFPLLKKIFSISEDSPILISTFNYIGIKTISEYIGIKTIFEISSINYPETRELDRTNRILEICKINKATDYINAIGGNQLYAKQDFKRENINLNFIEPVFSEYNQFNNSFIPWLSIIDVLMFNPISVVSSLLKNYKLS